MFKLNGKYEYIRNFLNSNFIRFPPAETSAINTPNNQRYFSIPRKDSVISLLNSYFELIFEVIKKTDVSRYTNGDDIRLVNLGSIALCNNLKLMTSCGKLLKGITHAERVSSRYKLITTSRDSDDLSIGFDRDRLEVDYGSQELTINKKKKVNFMLQYCSKTFLGLRNINKKLHMASVLN